MFIFYRHLLVRQFRGFMFLYLVVSLRKQGYKRWLKISTLTLFMLSWSALQFLKRPVGLSNLLGILVNLRQDALDLVKLDTFSTIAQPSHLC